MREPRRLLRAQQEKAIDELRYAVVESASIRTEAKALRDDKSETSVGRLIHLERPQ